MSFTPISIYGVDFSGAAKAGRTIWICRAESGGDRLQVRELDRLDRIVGHVDRDPALAGLVELIQQSDTALWGMDFPFGLPIELGWPTWPDQLAAVQNWQKSTADFGRHCRDRSLASHDKQHIRRTTDTETKTPFDCYHYRIIYQTFHGMRDVLAPLRADATTAVVPFEITSKSTRRVVAEACPSSTIKRLGLPHQNYKQPAGGPLTAKRRRTRKHLYEGLAEVADVPDKLLRKIQRDPGGDAMDAVLAAVGVANGWQAYDAAAVAKHERYGREGMIFM